MRGDVTGLMQLLLSAQTSLEQYADQSCNRIISKCIADFRKRYAVSDTDFAESIVWTEPSAAALMRLLVYAQGEAANTLNDTPCAEALQECIISFMKAHELKSKHLYGNVRLHG